MSGATVGILMGSAFAASRSAATMENGATTRVTAANGVAAIAGGRVSELYCLQRLRCPLHMQEGSQR
jgi:hypothetical protein